MKTFWLTVLLAVFAFCFISSPTFAGTDFYWPYDFEPPGPPPNYNLVDSSYFQGVPPLPNPLENHVGGYYIWNDTSQGTWHIANFIYTRGESRSQFHGSILAIMEQDPAPNVNFWAQGFELTSDLKQNDRWGWVKWPEEIYPNLYEIWWDFTIDYTKPNVLGDYRDTLGVSIAGCAVDFNIWSSGQSEGTHFSAYNVFLGDDKIRLSEVPGFTDTYAGVYDQYQINNPVKDPNTSRFTSVALPGASYNKNGLISPLDKCNYNDRYSGSWTYNGNGVQFATLFCPPNNHPNFVTPADNDTITVTVCYGAALYDTVIATDPDPADILTLSILSGPGSLTSTPSTTPVTGYYEFWPSSDGLYTVFFEVLDDYGMSDTITVFYDVTINTAPVVNLPDDTTLYLCEPTEFCVPLEIIDNDCDITSVTTNLGQYSGTVSDFDQVNRINQLGGTLTQVGGGYDGKVLLTASDFVPPVNSQSGVSVTLPNFAFAESVYENGYFPTGLLPANSVDHLLSSPTDLTYTIPGTGGPDGGDGDGSVDFSSGDFACLGFSQTVTTCGGSNSDFVIFTNTSTGGTANFRFKIGNSDVYTLAGQTIPAAGIGTGTGGIVLDLPDGLTFDRIRIEYASGAFAIDAIAARTVPSTTSADICFLADTTGVYEITASATDVCGNTGNDVMYVTVAMNRPPVADAGDNFTLFVCNNSEVCFDVAFSDPDGNLDYGTLYSGPGTLNGNQICFTPSGAGNYTFVIKAVDECVLTDFDTVAVTVNTNDPPVAAQPSPVTTFLCAPQELCHNFTASDPDGGTLTWSLLNGQGSIDASGHYCFTPTLTGSYNATVAVTDSCGVADTTWITYHITVNTAPVATNPNGPYQVFQCATSQICYQFTAADAEGGTIGWTKLSGNGTVNATGLWCFTPVGNGAYSATVAVTDSCGRADTVGLTYNVTLNGAPTITFGSDSTLTLCTPQEICLDYEVTDPQGTAGLEETMEAGFGAIDTSANQICFTPATAGSYEFIVRVTDSCDTFDEDTIMVNVSFGELAAIECPAAPINVSLCEIDSVCQLLNITPATASVSVSYGVWNDGEVCFLADTSGTYHITVIASETCGSDTCMLIFNVNIGQAAQIDCPDPQSIFRCQAGTICIPVGVMGPGATVTISPIGTYSGGNLCFPADTSGHYEITFIASTTCGTDTCIVVADIAINSAPAANDPASPVDTFICDPTQICYQFSAADADGGTLSWSRLSGNGTVSSAGLWCFNATVSGTFSVTARVTDSCGAYDDVTLTYNVGVNSSPVFSFGADTTIPLCTSEMVCIRYDLLDINNNIESLDIISGVGLIYPSTNKMCFTPVAEGLYQFIVEATDSCGASDRDTINVYIDFNAPPAVDAGSDQTVFQCELAEICWPTTVSDPDGNLATVELVSTPGIYDGSNICFTPMSGTMNYEFILKATDDCGLETFDTVIVYYTLNTPPVANAGSNQTVFQCTPAEICWPVSCTDADGNLTGCDLVEGPGDYNGTSICFTPAASGSYMFVLEAADACSEIDRDTVIINVTVNSAPVCTVPDDTTIFKCSVNEVCLPAYGTDIDGNLSYCQLISGPGVLSGGNWCYTPSGNQTVTVKMRCVDACGATCESQFTVVFEINEPPTIAFGNDTSIFLCTSSEVCLPYSVYDPNDPRLTTVTLQYGPGTLDEDNSRVCFTPTADGEYTFIVRIEDECGETDSDTIKVYITTNTAPTAFAGEDQSLFLCQSETLCWPASCSDVDGNLTDCIFSGPGEYSGSSICFTPTATGQYYFTLQAIDECAVEMIDTVRLSIVINTPPGIVMANDTSVFLCSPTEICVGYNVYDDDGLAGVKETMISGFGAIDTANNRVCFTPTEDGLYEIIVGVTDSCTTLPKAYIPQVDTVNVTVTFGEFATIDCPEQPLDVFLCEPDQVCQMLAVSPASAAVTTSFGTYAAGELCFQADTSGTYNIRVIAEASCGTDTCDLVFDVNIGEEPQIDCPAPQNKFICSPDDVCIPVGVMGEGAMVTVSPIGEYVGGHLCFLADTSGHYEIEMIATTSCGADTCVVEVEVVINSNPVIADPTSPVDTFICAVGQICYQFSAGDVDGGALTWSRLSGAGTVSSSGLWCFDANNAGSYTVVVTVTDSCLAKDTATLTYNITLNSSPVVTLQQDTTFFLCDLDSVCVGYAVADDDDNITAVELVSGAGVLKTTENLLCFLPGAAGTYQFIIRATDACSAIDDDTISITIAENRPPSFAFNAPSPNFLCYQAQVCWPVTVVDLDHNLDTAYVLNGSGVYSGGQLCFDADTSGIYIVTLYARDDCGAETQSTPLEFDITINSAPVCNIPNDTTFFQCLPEQVFLPVTAADIDGNFDHCEIITGPGSIVSGNWTYTPTTDENIKVVIMCIDDCGIFCKDSFTVVFDQNSNPTVNAGADTTCFLCASQTICRQAVGADSDGNLESLEMLSTTGTFDENSGEFCFTPTGGDQSKTFIFKATDSCGATDYDTTVISVDFNAPPAINAPPDFVAYLDQIGELCFDVDVHDEDGNLSSVTVTPFGAYNGSDQVCFTPDTTGRYCLVITAGDACGLTVVDTVCIDVQIDECVHVQIEKVHNTLQGMYETVDIFLNGSGKELGGYDLLISYDASALTAADIYPGALYESCGWEYFTYRYGPDGNCGSGCPSGLLRIVALAETNNGAYHPGCFLDGMVGTLASIKFLVSNDRNLECQYIPISFYWLECTDNTFSSRGGDTLWVSRFVYDFEYNDISNYTYGLPGFYGAPNDCLIGDKIVPIRCIDFINGGIDIICADSIDDRGDINLNGVAYEISDAVMLTNYFVYGLSAFGPEEYIQGAIAASDINADGIPLSVADLVYLIRVIINDIQPYTKPVPHQDDEAEFALVDKTLMITNATCLVGALHLVIDGEAEPTLADEAAAMELQYNYDAKNNKTNVIIYNMQGKSFPEEGPVLNINGPNEISSIEAGSFDGTVMKAQINNLLPENFALSQNYPNPFNPMTTIEFALPQACKWKLSVYNILGQVVETWSDQSKAGYYKLEWDAHRYASGVYFYRLTAGNYSATKKMVLLK
ncbi:MAG: Ig-like domain-containing protein [Candidatus Zixiibacteriota bacterium]